jgi:hypothetical protein
MLHGLTRESISNLLLVRTQAARDAYVADKRDSAKMERYVVALKEFNEFLFDGKIPKTLGIKS